MKVCAPYINHGDEDGGGDNSVPNDIMRAILMILFDSNDYHDDERVEEERAEVQQQAEDKQAEVTEIFGIPRTVLLLLIFFGTFIFVILIVIIR